MDKYEILAKIEEYRGSQEYRLMKLYADYYLVKNPDLVNRTASRASIGKTPNWFVPTAYYPTIVDSMAGFLFGDVEYTGDSVEVITELMRENNGDVKDMLTGTYALAYGRAYELVYKDDNGIRFASVDPLQIIPIYSDTIEQELEGAIWVRESNGVEYVDYITKDVWQYYKKTQTIDEATQEVSTNLEVVQEEKELLLSECPVIEYRSTLIGNGSPFDNVINYIIALDWAITGNSNEIDRLVDALLVIGSEIAKGDLEFMDSWKAITGVGKDEIAPYFIDKNSSPEFRRYVTELLINEIHKHSHVIDWYAPESGGNLSAKALKIRLFDMNLFSKRIEKVYKNGIYKRLRLLDYYSTKIDAKTIEGIVVEFNRTLPDDTDELLINLRGADWISMRTKQRWTGLDPDDEMRLLQEEQPEIDLSMFEGL